MKKLRYVLEATERSARDPRVKLTTGSTRHRSTTSTRPTRPDSHPMRAAPPGAMRANGALRARSHVVTAALEIEHRGADIARQAS
jgi:hypothetical protein